MHQTLAPQLSAVASPHDEQPASGDDRGLDGVRRKHLDTSAEYRHFHPAGADNNAAGMKDFLVARDDEPHNPDQIFSQLRWGGRFVYASRDRKEVATLPQRLADRGFVVDRGPAFIRNGWGIPLISPKTHYLFARKTALIPPREFSDRFTYQVELQHSEDAQPDGSAALGTDHWVVRKEIPTFERVLARLQFKAPDVPAAVLERRAKKFVEQIFPLFLTRESAMLKIIERDCPKEFLHHFPRLVDMEKDSKGYVHRLWTTWLRNGGKPLTQLEFAKQSAQVLHILHDKIGIIHLDLRMDNMVVTEKGVGFVDFGSAVRVDENIHGNAVLSTLFGELMRTSQIQRMMDRMSTAGALTSNVIREAYQQVDKSVDVFYLAVQISQPTANPDLHDLVHYDKHSPEAMELARLTNDILRPTDPNRPHYRTARDVLHEILHIEQKLKADATPRVVITSAPQPAPAHAPAATAEAIPVPAGDSKAKVWIWNS
jgi:hypothetical protein